MRIHRMGHPWVLCAGILLLGGSAAVRGGDSETREFAVLVDGKPAGTATMTIQRQDDGSTVVSSDTNVMVKVLIKKYVYTCQAREVWKDGRLREAASRCNDDGKGYQVSAVAAADGVHVRVNGRERTIRPEVWLSSYWTLPDAKVRNQLPVLDIDNGREMRGGLQYLGAQQIAVAGELQNVHHYRLTGTVRVDLYYDANERLVRREWVEEGHPTSLELRAVRK